MNTWRAAFLWFLAIMTAVRVFYAIRLGLGDDEAYYWEWGQRLALSYFDHPPLTAWIGRITCEILGNNEGGFRAGALASSFLFTALLYMLAFRITGSDRTAFFSAVFISWIPIFAAGAFMMVPDAPLSLFWMASLYVFSRLIDTKRPAWWYVLGVLFGLGLLSKYNMILLPLCAAAFFALSKEHRFWLKRLEPYYALCIGIIIFSPVISWNASHGFSSFAFQFAGRHAHRLSWLPFQLYLAGQLGYLSPLVFVAALGAMVQLTRKALWGRDPKTGFLFSFSVPYFLVFSIACSLSPTSKPHWPVLGYIPALLYCAQSFDGALAGKPRRRRPLTVYGWLTFGTMLLVSLLLYCQSLYPVIKLSGNADATNELYGWNTVGRRIDEMIQSGSGPAGTFIFATRYNIASQVAFYTGGRYPVYSINPKREQHDIWGRGSLEGLEGKNAIFVSDERYTNDATREYRFEHISGRDTVCIFRAGRPVKMVYLTQCFHFLGPASRQQ